MIEALLQQIEQQLSVGHTLSPEEDNALTTWSHVLEVPSLTSPGARKALASFAEHTRHSAEAKQAAGDAIAASDYSVFSDQASKLLGGTLAEGTSSSKLPDDTGTDAALTENTRSEDSSPPREADRTAAPGSPAADSDTAVSTPTQVGRADPPAEPAQQQQADAEPAPTQADHAVSSAEPVQPQQTEATPAPTQANQAVPPSEPTHPLQAEATPAPTQAEQAVPSSEPTHPQQAEATPAPPQGDPAAPPTEPTHPQQAEAIPAPTQADQAVSPSEPAHPQQAEAIPAPTQSDQAVPPSEPAHPQQAEATPAPPQADRAVPPTEPAQQQATTQAPPSPMQVARGDSGAPMGRFPTADTGENRAAKPDAVPGAPMPTMTPALSTTEHQGESDQAAALARRGDAMVAIKDISAARKFYQYAANAGSARAATALGETYDPAFLAHLGTIGLKPDVAIAASWYKKAAALGDRGADKHLQALALGPAK